MAFAFLRDKDGLSPVRREWDELTRRDPASAARLVGYLTAVEKGGDPAGNTALSYATSLGPDLYWYAIKNEGAFYTFDGRDLVIVKVARVKDAKDLERLSLAAEERI